MLETHTSRATLKNVKPYRSVWAHRHRRIYHDRADCPEGQRLYSDHLAAGTGGLPLCEECRALHEQTTEAPAA